MRKVNILTALTLAALISPAAMAQDPAPAAVSPATSAAAPVNPAAPDATAAAVATVAEPAPACELHVWPAARVGASTQGMGAAFGLIGALVDQAAHADQNKRDEAFITAALDANAQAKALRDLDLPALLHLPPSTVIIHEQGIDLKSDTTQRLTNSSAKCYYEFVVRGLGYLKTVAYRAQMRTFLSIRGFDGATIKSDFRDSKHQNLEVQLPKEGEDTGPATNSLMSAFKFDVNFFANKYVKKNG